MISLFDGAAATAATAWQQPLMALVLRGDDGGA